ncbi:hypothetical protein MCETHM1_00192 [Flavobacteriaceae bacterium]
MEINAFSLGLLLWQIFLFSAFAFFGYLVFRYFKKLK